ncbi:cohesin domain-containing protein [Lachnospiraceae bacterium OttesenSCG-928-J05]|nr:cohesin domain-containing protein [Lachnospiraceae bacterium OttesenSCG-928-J05]
MTIVLIAFCVTNFKIDIFAASNLYFDDPTLKVGEEVNIRIFVSEPENVTNGKGSLQYDASMLEFVSGTGASVSGSEILLDGSKNAEGKLEYYVVFKALKVGTTKITPTNFTATNNGSAVDVVLGDSTVTIEVGANGETEVPATEKPVTSGGMTIDVNGVQYTVLQDFQEGEIPQGFVASELTFEGQQVKSAKQELGDVELLFLQSAEGETDFYVYDKEDGSICPFEQIYVTNDFYIILLDDKASGLPSYYQETQMTVNGKEFPAWQNTKEPDFYAVSAVSSKGEKGIYTYDSIEETYQRYVKVTADEKDATSKLGTLLSKYESMIPVLLVVVGALFLLLLIILIVVSTKLRHRNLEIDDLYDEYGIDTEEEEVELEEGKSKRQRYEEDDDEFDTFDADSFDDTDDLYEEESDILSFDDDFDDDDEFGETEELDFDDITDEDDELDDLRFELDGEDELQNQLKKKDKSSRKVFDTDFIDLD